MQDLPRNPTLERAVLSAFLLDPRQYKKLRSRLTPDLFTVERHVQVARAMDSVYRAGLDLTMLSVISEIDRDDAISDSFRGAGEGVALLAELTTAGIPSSSADTHLRLAEELAAKRNILKATEELAAMARNGADATDLARVLAVYSKRMERVLTNAEILSEIDLAAACVRPLAPIPWIAEGWIAEDDRVLFGGEWGTGKSLIVDDLALSVATGIDWLGSIPILKSGPVLYVDEENPRRVVESRFYRMVRGRNLDPAIPLPIRYMHRNRIKFDRGPGLGVLRRVMDEHRPVLVILDSMARFHNLSENDNSEMSAFLDDFLMPLVIDYGCAFVVLDHMRKPGKEDAKQEVAHRIRGAGSKMDIADAAWVIHGDRNSNDRIFECRKNRSEERRPVPVTTKWVEEGDSAWIEAAAEKQGAELRVWGRLSHAEEAGALRRDVLKAAQDDGFSKRGFEKALDKLKAGGRVKQRLEGGKLVRLWLAEHAPDDAE